MEMDELQRGMKKRYNRHIQRSIDLARDLIILSDKGEADSRDDGCIALYGVVRDCGYRIRAHAEREKTLHKTHGMWTNETGARGDEARC